MILVMTGFELILIKFATDITKKLNHPFWTNFYKTIWISSNFFNAVKNSWLPSIHIIWFSCCTLTPWNRKFEKMGCFWVCFISHFKPIISTVIRSFIKMFIPKHALRCWPSYVNRIHTLFNPAWRYCDSKVSRKALKVSRKMRIYGTTCDSSFIQFLGNSTLQILRSHG